ncbi:uncharacterized protein LOC113322310 [Papaver somniferum]|uniref:uncharacterized protein LOC113322310 n=1 Tax=Papaver somniferum TaxID=3469 RepID=UPI000E6F55B9|nr:uncharacterized protein LOC113322310 [Papaver somniferum]
MSSILTSTSSSPNKQSSIYALASNDGPGTIITHVVLKGSNYEEWDKGFRISLGAKRKLGFINGKLSKPSDDSSDLDDWWTINYMIVAWIFNTIDPVLRSSISYCDTAFDLWEDIRLRFSLGNGIKKFQLKSDVAGCKQKDGESIQDYYGRLKKLWDDINDFDALPSFKCSGCTCDLNLTLRTRRNNDQVREFLMGLIPYYANVRSRILGTEPLPSLHTVYSRLIQEEEVRSYTQPKEDIVSPMAFLAHGNKPQGSKSGAVKTPLKCTYCGHNGHLEDRCWEKHGYPDGRQPRRPPAAYLKTESPVQRTQPAAKANAVVGEMPITNPVRLSGKRGHIWIVDTGASNHVCCDDTVFESCHNISPLQVGLPNGVSIQATKIGIVQLNDFLILHNVLFVPQFTCNLLSVSQLLSSSHATHAQKNNISVQFTNSECVIQDHTLRTRIGMGKLMDGLYCLMGKPARVNVVLEKTAT